MPVSIGLVSNVEDAVVPLYVSNVPLMAMESRRNSTIRLI